MAAPAFNGGVVSGVMAEVAEEEANADESAAAQVAGETSAAEQVASESQASPAAEPVAEPAARKIAAAQPNSESTQPRKRGFFASFFSPAPNAPQNTAAASQPPSNQEPVSAEAKPQAPDQGAEEAQQSAGAANAESELGAQAATEAATQETAKPDDASAQLAEVKTEPQKRGFLASLFAPAGNQAPAQTAFAPSRPSPASEAEAAVEPAPTVAEQPREEEAEPLVDLASVKKPMTGSQPMDFLPGVRNNGSLFEITYKSGVEDSSDVDVYEDSGAPVILASAAGMARLAPNGLLKQRHDVDVACLKPALVRILKTVERRFGKKLIVTSGYRSPAHNRRVNGARRSQHMYCAAADVQVPGVSKWELAKFVRALPGRGGVGTYCHTASVHIDVGPERDWNWRCKA
jgi:uncharacterized protein YcbK (DUF882 family)